MSYGTDTPRILIADDQADVLKALRLLLKPAGYEITTASSVDEIVAAVSNNDFDVVLMDPAWIRPQTHLCRFLQRSPRVRVLVWP